MRGVGLGDDRRGGREEASSVWEGLSKVQINTCRQMYDIQHSQSLCTCYQYLILVLLRVGRHMLCPYTRDIKHKQPSSLTSHTHSPHTFLSPPDTRLPSSFLPLTPVMTFTIATSGILSSRGHSRRRRGSAWVRCRSVTCGPVRRSRSSELPAALDIGAGDGPAGRS